MNRLDQLFAQSQREIEAHAVEIAATATGRYYIDEAAHLLAGLRMWAQAQYRSDQVVREILEAGDATVLQQVARELRLMKNREATVASWPIEAIRSGRQNSGGLFLPTPSGRCDVERPPGQSITGDLMEKPGGGSADGSRLLWWTAWTSCVPGPEMRLRRTQAIWTRPTPAVPPWAKPPSCSPRCGCGR